MKGEKLLALKLFGAVPVKKLLSQNKGTPLALGGESLKMWIQFPGRDPVSVRPISLVNAESNFVLLEILGDGKFNTVSDDEMQIELCSLLIELEDAFRLKKHRSIECKFPPDNRSSVLLPNEEALLISWKLEGILLIEILERISINLTPKIRGTA